LIVPLFRDWEGKKEVKKLEELGPFALFEKFAPFDSQA